MTEMGGGVRGVISAGGGGEVCEVGGGDNDDVA